MLNTWKHLPLHMSGKKNVRSFDPDIKSASNKLHIRKSCNSTQRSVTLVLWANVVLGTLGFDISTSATPLFSRHAIILGWHRSQDTTHEITVSEAKSTVRLFAQEGGRYCSNMGWGPGTRRAVRITIVILFRTRTCRRYAWRGSFNTLILWSCGRTFQTGRSLCSSHLWRLKNVFEDQKIVCQKSLREKAGCYWFFNPTILKYPIHTRISRLKYPAFHKVPRNTNLLNNIEKKSEQREVLDLMRLLAILPETILVKLSDHQPKRLSRTATQTMTVKETISVPTRADSKPGVNSAKTLALRRTLLLNFVSTRRTLRRVPCDYRFDFSDGRTSCGARKGCSFLGSLLESSAGSSSIPKSTARASARKCHVWELGLVSHLRSFTMFRGFFVLGLPIDRADIFFDQARRMRSSIQASWMVKTHMDVSRCLTSHDAEKTCATSCPARQLTRTLHYSPARHFTKSMLSCLSWLTTSLRIPWCNSQAPGRSALHAPRYDGSCWACQSHSADLETSWSSYSQFFPGARLTIPCGGFHPFRPFCELCVGLESSSIRFRDWSRLLGSTNTLHSSTRAVNSRWWDTWVLRIVQ